MSTAPRTRGHGVGRRGGQVVKESGIEDRDLRDVGQQLAGHSMPRTAGGLCSGASAESSSSSAITSSSRSVGAVESPAAVDNPMPDRHQAQVTGGARLGELPEREPQRRLVVGDRDRRRSARRCRRPPESPESGSTTANFSDDEPELTTSTVAITVHDLPCAWIAVIATVLTMSSTSAPRDRSLTGLFRPCSTGPIAIAPALRCTAL